MLLGDIRVRVRIETSSVQVVDVVLGENDDVLAALCYLEYHRLGDMERVSRMFREAMCRPSTPLEETGLIADLWEVADYTLIDHYRYLPVGDLIGDLAEQARESGSVPLSIEELSMRSRRIGI